MLTPAQPPCTSFAAWKRRPLDGSSLVLLVVLLVGALAPHGSTQQVFVLGPSPGGPGIDFTNFNTAVNAIPTGSILLVKAGGYGYATVSKSLSIVADSGASVGLSVLVEDLPAGQAVLIRGIGMNGTSGHYENNLGHVRLENCEIQFGEPPLTLSHCADVALVNCKLVGMAKHYSDIGNVVPPSAALEIEDSNVLISGGEYVGGNSHVAIPLEGPMAGAAAVIAHSGLLVVSGASLTGGDGSNGITIFPGICLLPGQGGAALRLGAGAPTGVIVDSLLVGGIAGDPAGGCSLTSPDGPPAVVQSGTLTTLPGSASTLVSNAPVREGQSLTLTLAADPGALALLALGVQPTYLYAPGLHGVLGVSVLNLLTLGAVPAGGTIVLSATVPPLGPALEGAVLHLQAVTHGGAPGTTVLGQLHALTLLDAAL